MQASEFEYRHPTLLSQLLIGAGLLTYLFDPRDVVWRFIEQNPSHRQLEHVCFMTAALLIGAAAVICSSARARYAPADEPTTRRSYRAGEVLYAIGLGTLMPLAGFLLVVAGQTVRVLRLAHRTTPPSESRPNGWLAAMRKEVAKWGLLVTMACFSVTLVDKQADYLAAASYFAWAVLNLPRQKTSEAPLPNEP